MNKIRVIDILNKIANGEEVPEKIKYDGQIFEYRDDMKDYYCYYWGLNLMGYQKCLNEDVQLLEDTPKKIEKIEYIEEDEDNDFTINGYLIYKEQMIELASKLNEIIDYINGGNNE